MDVYKTDILVIGGGLAGLVAAIEGLNKGENQVMLVSKSKIGSSGNTIISTGYLSAYVKDNNPGDSEKLFKNDIIKAGEYINNQEMVDMLVQKSGEALLKLEQLGVNFLTEDGVLKKHRSPGHCQSRGYQAISEEFPYTLQGMAITVPLAKAAQEKGVKFLEGVTITTLTKYQDRVVGAWGLTRSGEKIAIMAKGVIVATGGCGQLFSNNNNTNDITGDSFGLALNMGASLQDMEFMQFYPTMMLKPTKIALTTTLFSHGAVLRNRQGEEFIFKYDPQNGHMTTRDIMSRAIYTEIMTGRSIEGGVHLDFSLITENKIKEDYPSLYKTFVKSKTNPWREKIIVTPVAHFFMGGMTVNRVGYTGVLGLWAAGEAIGGVHGANRLSGNALTEAVVFGIAAGQEAATYCQKMDHPPQSIFKLDGEIVYNLKGDTSVKESVEALKEALWQDVSIVRDEKGLNKANDIIGKIIENLPYIKTSSPYELKKYLELKNSLVTAQAIIKGALVRKESRGAHYRKDYPNKDDRFLNNIKYKNDNS